MLNSNSVRMILCHRACNAQHRFLNNIPNVFTDFRFRDATTTAVSDAKVGAKSTVQAQMDFGYVILSNRESKVIPNRGQIWSKMETGWRCDFGALLGWLGGKRRKCPHPEAGGRGRW